MKIERWQQCHQLPKGQLVVDADGEIWRITKYKDETWLEHFSDEYATVIKPDGTVPHQSTDNAKLSLTAVKTAPVDADTTLVDLQLSEDERRVLAVKATYESTNQDDFRYQSPDPGERARLKARWQQIADALHPDPWGTAKTEEES